MLLEQGGAQTPIGVVSGPQIGPDALAPIEAHDVGGPLAEVRPEFLFRQEALRATGKTEHPYVRLIRVGIGLLCELGPVGVDDLSGQYVCLVSRLPSASATSLT